jgi:hypothetical protein
MGYIPVTVVLKDNVDPETVEAELGRAGLRVTGRLRSIGALNGSIDSESLSKLNTVPGVASVSESRSIPGPSPDSDIQ